MADLIAKPIRLYSFAMREREILNFDGFKRAVVDDGSFLLRCIPFVQYSEGDVILEEE